MPVNGQQQCGAVNERIVRCLSWGLNDNWTPRKGASLNSSHIQKNERGLSHQTQQGCRRGSPPISPVPGQIKGGGRCALSLWEALRSGPKGRTEEGGKSSLSFSLMELGGVGASLPSFSSSSASWDGS